MVLNNWHVCTACCCCDVVENPDAGVLKPRPVEAVVAAPPNAKVELPGAPNAEAKKNY